MKNSSFSALGIQPEILKAVNEMGFEAPTSIQEKCIPQIVKGKNVIGMSQTGSGKTAAFLDLSGILKTDYEGEIDVLNGIAYDPENNSFLVTGKLWPKIYRIKIIE